MMLHNVDPITTAFFNHAIDCNISCYPNTIETSRKYFDPNHKDFENDFLQSFLDVWTDDQSDAHRLEHAVDCYANHLRYVQAVFAPFDKEMLADLYEKVKLVMPYVVKGKRVFGIDDCGSPWSYSSSDPAKIALRYATFNLERDEASADPNDPDVRDEVGELIQHAVAVLNMTAEQAGHLIREHLFDEE